MPPAFLSLIALSIIIPGFLSQEPLITPISPQDHITLHMTQNKTKYFSIMPSINESLTVISVPTRPHESLYNAHICLTTQNLYSDSVFASNDITLDSECNYIHIPCQESQSITEYYLSVWCPYTFCDVTLSISYSTEHYISPRAELIQSFSQDDVLTPNMTMRYITDIPSLDQSIDSLVVEIVPYDEKAPWFNVYMNGLFLSQKSYAYGEIASNKAQKGVYLLKKPINKNSEDQLEVVVGCEDDCRYRILVSFDTHQEATEDALKSINSTKKDHNQTLGVQSSAENLLDSIKLSPHQADDYEYVEISKNILKTLAHSDPDLSDMRLYYYTSNSTDVVIKAFVYCNALLLSIFINIVDTSKYTSEAEWPYPTPEAHNFSVLNSSLMNTLIPSEAFLEYGCRDSCGLAISIASVVNPTPANLYLVDVLITQGIIKTDLGKVAQGTIQPNEYRYYSVDVDRVQTKLLASVGGTSPVTRTNQLIFFVSKGAEERPWEHRPEFTSYNDELSGLILLQLSQEGQVDNSMQGTWVIGVHLSGSSQSSVNFRLSISFEEQQVNSLIIGYYLPVSLSKGQDFYFHLTNLAQVDFFIRSVVMKGSAECFATTIDGSLTILENLPSAEHNYWSAPFTSVENYLTINQSDPNYCTMCGYLIGVRAIDDVEMTLFYLDASTKATIRGDEPFVDYTNNNMNNEYYGVFKSAPSEVYLRTYSADLTIYIRNFSQLNETDYIWKCTTLGPNSYSRFRIVADFEETLMTYTLSLPDCSGPSNLTLFDLNSLSTQVTSAVPSKYLIGLSSCNQTNIIGLVETSNGFLNPGGYETYGFIPLEITSFRIYLYRDYFTSVLEDTYMVPNITFAYVPDPNATPNITIISPFRSSVMRPPQGPFFYMLIVEYPQFQSSDEDGSYSLQILNNDTHGHLNYSIDSNQMSPIELPVNTVYTSRTAVGMKDVYTVRVDQPGTLLIEVHTCIGEVEVGYSSSYVPSAYSDLHQNQTVRTVGNNNSSKP